jgi:hypothetical protein
MAECNLYAPDGPVRHHVPRYLYRGECGLFPTTESSQLRLERSGEFNPKEQEALRKVVSALRSVFKQPDYDNTEADAEGLLEHYGVPSPIINFTSSPDIAAVFAAAADADAEYGRICILTRPYKGGAMVFDYRQHPFAVRAWRQMGFGVVPQGFTDLKSREADIRLGAIWVEFRISAADRAAVSPAYRYLLNASDDYHSAIARVEVNHFIEQFGKLPHKVAVHLAKRIPMVPLLSKVDRVDDLNREVVTYRVAPSECPFSEVAEREMSLRYWSAEYPDSLLGFYPFKSPKSPGSVFAWPGTYHGPATDALTAVESKNDHQNRDQPRFEGT